MTKIREENGYSKTLYHSPTRRVKGPAYVASSPWSSRRLARNDKETGRTAGSLSRAIGVSIAKGDITAFRRSLYANSTKVVREVD
jgi:hypothetical protein